MANFASLPKGKKATIFVVGGAVAFGGYLWYRHHQQNAASASTSSGTASGTDQYPPDGTTGDPTDPYSTDPATGMTYGDEGNFGSSGFGSGIVSGLGSGGFPTSGSPTPPSPVPGPGPITTNGQWAKAAETYLTSHAGVNRQALAAALGRYLTGQELTPDEKSLIDQAIAFLGYPPQKGINGYPPKMHVKPHQGQGKGKDTKTVEAPGGKTLKELAPTYHTTYAKLAQLNPAVARKYLGRAVPQGTKLIVPA